MSARLEVPAIQPPPITADVSITIIEPNSNTVVSKRVRVTVASANLHNLGGLTATETERAVAELVRKIGDASGKRPDREDPNDGTVVRPGPSDPASAE